MYLNEEQLSNVIISYIFDHNQAVLINGDWGSGKTHFIKKELISKLNDKIDTDKVENDVKKPQVAYISLYGISSLDDIKNAIYMSFLENLCDKNIISGKGSQIIKGAKLISKLVLPHLDINKEVFDSLETIIKEYSENSNYIIIFDDIERCDIDVNQLLGYINGLVEHSSIKAILVGNEKEFLSHKVQFDLPQKYSTVLNERIDWERKTKDGKKEDVKTLLTKQQLLEYTEELFSSDIVYQKIKEKLIGLTVQYHPNTENVYSSICEEYINDNDAKKFMIEKKRSIIDIFNNRKHLNLRTLIFVLISFEKIYQIGIDNEQEYDKDSIDEIRLKILKYVTELAIKIKTGQSLPVWTNSEEQSRSIYLTKSGVFGDTITGYQFVDVYLLTGYLDTKMCEETILDFLNKDKVNRDEKAKNLEISKLSYNNMYQWWKLEDNEVQENLEMTLKELDGMKYPPRYFKDILVTWFQLHFNKFKDLPPIKSFTNPMKSYIENKEIDDLRFIDIWTDDIEFKTKYNEAVSELREAIEVNMSTTKQIRYDMNAWFKESFLEYCRDEHDKFLNMRQFISLVKSEEIISMIKTSNTAEIYNFLDGIKSVYRFSNLNEFFRSDLQTIVEVLESLNEEDLSNGSITKGIAIKNVIEKLEDVKSILER